MGILGGFMFFVGLVMDQWYNRMAKYGEEPAQDVNIFILRWMLWAGLVILAVAAAHFYWQRRSAQAEEEEAEEDRRLKANPRPRKRPSSGWVRERPCSPNPHVLEEG